MLTYLSEAGALDTGRVKVRAMTLPDLFQEHDKPDRMYETAALDAQSIVRKALDTLGPGANARRDKIA